LAITQLVYEISSRLLYQIGGFTGQPHKLWKCTLCQTSPCCHGNENLQIVTQHLL